MKIETAIRAVPKNPYRIWSLCSKTQYQRSRSHDAVIRVYDAAGDMMERHEEDFKKCWTTAVQEFYPNFIDTLKQYILENIDYEKNTPFH